MKTTTIIFVLLGTLTAQSQDYRLDSLFYALTKQSIGQSDKIVVNRKVRTPKAIWDNYWKRTKQNPYFNDAESEFIKSQIQNPIISRWNNRKLYKIPYIGSSDNSENSDEAILFTTRFKGKTTYFIDLPIMSANRDKVVIFYTIRNRKFGFTGIFITEWIKKNGMWIIQSSGLRGLTTLDAYSQHNECVTAGIKYLSLSPLYNSE